MAGPYQGRGSTLSYGAAQKAKQRRDAAPSGPAAAGWGRPNGRGGGSPGGAAPIISAKNDSGLGYWGEEEWLDSASDLEIVWLFHEGSVTSFLRFAPLPFRRLGFCPNSCSSILDGPWG